MRVTFLGTGTSFGVPMIGCECPVCSSDDPHDTRTRSSIHIQFRDNLACLVDTSVDLRQQALTHGIRRADAVFYTHTHSDHVNGLDELRSFNYLQRSSITCFGRLDHLDDIAGRFAHCFHPPQEGAGVPAIEMKPVTEAFDWRGVSVTPLPVKHGILDILGWRFDNFAYVTDASEISESTLALMEGVEVLVLNALRHTPHPTHMNIEQACAIADRIQPRETWFTHICHDLPHAETNVGLPSDRQLAHDGLVVEV